MNVMIQRSSRRILDCMCQLRVYELCVSVVCISCGCQSRVSVACVSCVCELCVLVVGVCCV